MAEIKKSTQVLLLLVLSCISVTAQIIENERFNINRTLVTPSPTANTKRLYQFLYDNYGKKVISGTMTLASMDEVKWLKANTGEEPALLGVDFMHCGRNYSWYNDYEPVNDARNYYNRNGIPAFCWHWRDPLRNTEAFYTKDTKFDISKIADTTSAEYIAMIKDIDYISGLLKKLHDEDIPVLWRPLHEASGGWFWWGAKGAEPCKKLYRLMYDRMVNHHGLKNLIWVWTSQQNDYNWYPGDDVVDMIGRDIYKEGDHSSQILEFNKLNHDYGTTKMVTLSECGSIPDPDNLKNDEAAWSYFMPWYGSFVRESKHNPLDLWKKLFAHDYVLDLSEMPDLKSYSTPKTGWRSKLYPANWKPGFKDGNDRYLHDFSYAGYHQGEKEIPKINDNIVNVTLPPYNADNTGTTDVTAIVQKALNDVGQAGGGVVYLPAGTYKINPGSAAYALRIATNNTILRGAGSDSTFIFNDTDYMREKNAILVQAGDANWASTYGTSAGLKNDLLYPTRAIPLKSVSGFKKGDRIILRTDGTEAFIAEHGMAGYWVEWAARMMFLRTIDSIDTINNLIYIDSPTRYFMKLRDNARVYHARPHITESGIEHLSIGNRQNNKPGWDEETYTESGTGAYDVHASHLIKLNYAENCWVKNVNTYKPSVNTEDIHVLSNCLLINQSRGITVDSCFFQKPQYEGGGGNGYMFTLQANDCLIKNCRANHSRHNYDFKFPYSNGNVIYNCIGENSKYSSDFHMYLSPANLIDNFTVDRDYLESVFRPYGGSVMHGYSSTQSVFYNTKGLAYHSNKNYIIESRQLKHGYIIGTSGAAYQVKTEPVEGSVNGYPFNSTPRDFTEGIGLGETLEPLSLYLDQLHRRLNDTIGTGLYKVSISVTDSILGAPLINCKVKIWETEILTDINGKADFEKVRNIVQLSISRENYGSLPLRQFPVYSDTTFNFTLAPRSYNITLVVHDKRNGQVFNGVKVTFNNKPGSTNSAGAVYFETHAGSFPYSIEKNDYENPSGILSVTGDSVYHFYLERLLGSVKIKLVEGVLPLNNATVVLNDSAIITNSLGLANFKNLAIRNEYSYLVYKDDYQDFSGRLYLNGDTTITIYMEAYPTFSSTHDSINRLKTWPNPADEILNIALPSDIYGVRLEIFNFQGTLLRKIETGVRQIMAIPLDGLTSGIYLLKIATTNTHFTQHFIKK